MMYMNRKIEFRIIGIVLAAILCLAVVPAVSASTYTLVSHTPDGYDSPLYQSGDNIDHVLSGIQSGSCYGTLTAAASCYGGDNGFTWNFYSEDMVLDDGYTTIGTTAYLPIGFVTDGTTSESFATSPVASGPYSYDMMWTGGSTLNANFVDSGAGVTKHYNLRKGTYTISTTGSTASSVYGIDWTIKGGQIVEKDSDPLTFRLTIPDHIKSGHLRITITNPSGEQVFGPFWYRIGKETPVTTETTPIVTTTTMQGESDSGGGGPAAAPQQGPLENGSFMQLKHDAAGNLIADYSVELDNSYGFVSTLDLTRPLTVLDSYGKPVEEIKVNSIDPNSILDLTKSNVFTFSGFAVECEPPGTQFSNGFALLTVTLTDAQWAAALAAVNGDTSAMTFKTYDETAGAWVDVPTTVDPVSHMITAQISHFSMYGLFYGTEASAKTFGNLMPTTTGGAAQQAPVETTAQLAPTTTTKSPAIPGIVVIGIVGLVAYFIVRKKE
jgi:hypothetical protein